MQILRRLVSMGAAARMGSRNLKKLSATPAECHKLWHSLRQFRHLTLFVSSALGAAATMLHSLWVAYDTHNWRLRLGMFSTRALRAGSDSGQMVQQDAVVHLLTPPRPLAI